MTKPMDFRQRWVLVTGASSGLGKEMARQLARTYGANLVLVARRAEKLQALAQQLEADHGVQCRVISADLTHALDVERVYQESIQHGDIYGVILNAGVTYFGNHDAQEWPAFETMLATNVSSVVRLVNLFVPYLLAKNHGGGLLLVSSLAGLLPVPYQSAYAGTKGFITQFGQSLYQELQGQPVSITTFCPGGIATEMTINSGLNYFADTPFVQSVQACAAVGLKGFARRQYLPVPGVLNRLQLFGARFLPRRLVGRIAARTYAAALRQAG